MLHVEDLIWDERNIEHIARHGVTINQVEEVCYSNALFKRGRNQILEAYGQTEDGRYLVAFLARRGKGAYYVVTARDMNDRERKTYRKFKGR